MSYHRLFRDIKSDEQQAAEEPIGIEEQKTIESQEAEAVEEGSTEDVNEVHPKTTEEIIGKAQEESKASKKQTVNEKPKSKHDRLQNYSISLPNTFRLANSKWQYK